MRKFLLLPLLIFCLWQTPSHANESEFIKADQALEYGNYQEAVKIIKPLAEQGNAEAQFNLGQLYRQGKGVPQNYSQAAKWYRLSAEQGNAEAQTNLGLLYENGKGVSQDYSKAIKWWQLSAKQGFPQAQSMLGASYGLGQGVPQSNIHAYMWISIAKANGQEEVKEFLKSVEKNLTPSGLEQAQALAQKCFNSNYKDCG